MIKAIKYLFDNIEEIIIVFFFSVMFIFMLLQLLSRYFLSIPLFFTEEVSRFSYIWLTFVGASYALKRGTHIRIEIFVQLLPIKVRKFLRIVVDAISIVIFLYLIIWGVDFANFMEIIKSPALEISMVYIAIAIPIGFTLSVIRSFKLLVEDIRDLITN